MSLDRPQEFDTRISMEPAVTELTMLPPLSDLSRLRTALDLYNWVDGDASLSLQQRRNEKGAIVWLGRVDDTSLEAILLDKRYLVDDRIARIRGEKQLCARRRSGIVSLLNRTFKRAGILTVGTRRAGTISSLWCEKLKAMSRDDARATSTFARFCTSYGVEPHEVTAATWERFVAETLKASTFKKPRKTVQSARAALYRAAARDGSWTLPALPKLENPRLVSIPKSEFPASFWGDIAAYIKASGEYERDPFDEERTKMLRPSTLVRYSDQLWRTASAQVRQGRPAAEIVSLKALLDFDWLQQAMRWHYHHAGSRFLKDHLNVAATWMSVADNWVRPPRELRDRLRKDIFDRIDDELGPAEFSERNLRKLEQFDSEEVADAFRLLPYSILAELKKTKSLTREDAARMAIAVAIEILLATMMRRRNVADLDLGKHFWPAEPTPGGKWMVSIPSSEVKNREPLKFALRPNTIALIEFYIQKCRPLLPKGPTKRLLLTRSGDPIAGQALYHAVKMTIRNRLGLDVNTHLFRHIGTMLFLRQQPGAFKIAQEMLGHKSSDTTQRYYARLERTQAIEFFTNAVLGGRDEAIKKLKLR